VLKSKTSKIILVVLGVLVIAGIVWYILSQNKSTPSAPEQGQITAGSKTAAGGGEFPTGGGTATTSPFSISPVASATATGQPAVGYRLPSAQPSATITPYPGSGEFDWTRNPPKAEATLPPSVQQNIQNKTICDIAGLSNNWSNPFEKTLCGITQFIEKQITTPLAEFSCGLAAAIYDVNYKSNITSVYRNGQCLIEDR
jgi:hypothetical protein